jgi:two-component system, OmpR family, sensor histidine kinase MprB
VSLRARVVVLTAAALNAIIVFVCVLAYVVVKNELYDRLDETLLARAAVLAPVVGQGALSSPRLPIVAVPGEYVQELRGERSLRPPYQALVLPVGPRERAVESGRQEHAVRTVTVGDTSLRLATVHVGFETALQVARPSADEEATLHRLRLVFFLLAGSGFLFSLALGAWIAETALTPMRRLTAAAERIAQTRDLALRLDEHGSDEVARLSTSFNAMLLALDKSLAAQRRLVADASHEFRTPLTSLRTNVELLSRGDALPEAERAAAVHDVVQQLDELAALVADVIELARDGEAPARREEVRFDELVADGIERAQRHAPNVRFQTDLEPCVVRGDPQRLARAVANLLDNASQWSPQGGTVELSLRDGELRVRDHGPGIEPDDLPLVFERFYRASPARGKPGSGLGLAIVRQVAETHGGSVQAANAEGGGAEFRLVLPAIQELVSE